MASNKPGGRNIAYLNPGESARLLGVDRTTFDALVKEGRIRKFPGVLHETFYRRTDLEKLRNELQSAVPASAGEPTSAAVEPPVREEKPLVVAPRKKDQGKLIESRLSADSRWRDISYEDIDTWLKQLSPDGYERNKQHARRVMQKLQSIEQALTQRQNQA
jgi:hypothetical protein